MNQRLKFWGLAIVVLSAWGVAPAAPAKPKAEPKIVAELTYPVTGKNCVDRIYTDLCVIDVTPEGLQVIEKVEGLGFDELQALTGATLIDATH